VIKFERARVLQLHRFCKAPPACSRQPFSFPFLGQFHPDRSLLSSVSSARVLYTQPTVAILGMEKQPPQEEKPGKPGLLKSQTLNKSIFYMSSRDSLKSMFSDISNRSSG
jgi:hypothetical protein